jgi:glycosyltransferase involved in cell wall biosynthesis
MKDTLVVIATHNGKDHVKKLLDSFIRISPNMPADILIVDTGSTDESHLAYLKELEAGGNHYGGLPGKVMVEYIPGGYCTGAYIHAYKNHPSRFYMFMHDSLEVKEADWLDKFIDPLRDTENGCVAFLTFGLSYDNLEQRLYVNSIFGDNHGPCGIFGPIFSTSFKMLHAFDEKGWLSNPPNNKNEQCGMERGWGVGFGILATPIRAINQGYSTDVMEADGYAVLKKYLVHRM